MIGLSAYTILSVIGDCILGFRVSVVTLILDFCASQETVSEHHASGVTVLRYRASWVTALGYRASGLR